MSNANQTDAASSPADENKALVAHNFEAARALHGTFDAGVAAFAAHIVGLAERSPRYYAPMILEAIGFLCAHERETTVADEVIPTQLAIGTLTEARARMGS